MEGPVDKGFVKELRLDDSASNGDALRRAAACPSSRPRSAESWRYGDLRRTSASQMLNKPAIAWDRTRSCCTAVLFVVDDSLRMAAAIATDLRLLQARYLFLKRCEIPNK